MYLCPAVSQKLADRKTITVDETLSYLMKGCTIGDKIPANDALEKFLQSLNAFHRIRGNPVLKYDDSIGIEIDTDNEEIDNREIER